MEFFWLQLGVTPQRAPILVAGYKRIRDRKDPRAKEGNNQKVPLLNLTGYDAWEIMLQQCIITRGWVVYFPTITAQ
ncbi:hypothetical protein [Bradyrhizobium sp. CCBAU 25338]|uniref:hypothetical protein n=1 Tax=Bradyrhizobium sp. CCBAU 25338 TaxID=1641877 RepID=UPI002304B6CB|nr:hypothetical protein [Bradyrhizobium sp. CCBAU 25338]MDA9530231.1 hypothetical protein [Bradyrhizobium sp. CCBAU 25338]